MLTPYYQDQNVTLYHGDTLRVLPQLRGHLTVDAVITDPPYSSGGLHSGAKKRSTRSKYLGDDAKATQPEFEGDSKDQRANTLWTSYWLADSKTLAKPGAIIGLFTDWRQLPTMTDSLQMANVIWRGVFPWSKPNGRRTQGRLANTAEYFVWGTNGARALEQGATLAGHWVQNNVNRDKLHQTQKPLELMEYLCETAAPGQTILDPFAGSGTTLLAAANTGRKAVGVEMSEEYCEIIAKRLEAGDPKMF